MGKKSYANRLMAMVYGFTGEMTDIIKDKGRIEFDNVIHMARIGGNDKVFYAAEYQPLPNAIGGYIKVYWRLEDDGQMTEYDMPLKLLRPEYVIAILDEIRDTINGK